MATYSGRPNLRKADISVGAASVFTCCRQAKRGAYQSRTARQVVGRAGSASCRALPRF
jgi:hypothetical protein